MSPTRAPACVITRTEPGASRTAEAVRALGWRPIACATREVRPVSIDSADLPSLPDGPVLLTSAQAARQSPSELTGRVALCVGAATASAARARGFAQVLDADGDQDALVSLVRASVAPGTALVWLRGSEVAADLGARLQADGYPVTSLTVYATCSVPDLPERLGRLLSEEGPGTVLVHSPAAARLIAEALGPADLGAWRLVTISQAALLPLSGYAWASVAVADAPNEAALLAALGSAV